MGDDVETAASMGQRQQEQQEQRALCRNGGVEMVVQTLTARCGVLCVHVWRDGVGRCYNRVMSFLVDRLQSMTACCHADAGLQC